MSPQILISILDQQNKETFVFLSTLPLTIVAYSPIWNELKKDYNLYAYDLPGFGASETSPEFMTFNFQGKFLDSFLKHFNIEKNHIVAPDVGMASALSYVINYDTKVKSLMIGDGPGALPAIEPSVMRKIVYSCFWRTMFTIAGSNSLIESAKNLGNVKYIPNKYEVV